MPEITSSPQRITVQLPVLRSVVSGEKVMLQVVGSMTVAAGDAGGMYVGPNGYTANAVEAQDFAPTVSEEQITIQSPGAPGKSAYQLWLDEGNIGSATDFLIGLRGDPGASGNPGAKGDTGEQGPPGVPGPKGDAGSPGVQGEKGEAGSQGAQGVAGAQGQQGIQGAPGKDGAAGPQGIQGPQGEKGEQGATGPTGPKGDTGPTGPSSMVTLGTVSLGQTATVAITAGVRSIVVSVPGVLAGDNILLFPTAAMPAGYAIHNAVATAKDTLQVTLTAPLLAIGASFSIACRVVALR